MQILAHRTAMANAPPNSLEGFRFCRARGVNVVECDLSFTRDEQPIIWQDDNNYFLEHPKFRISELTLGEIQGLKRKDCQEQLMVLSDVWSFLKAHPGFKILFDVKYYRKQFCIEGDFWGIIKRVPQHLIDLTLECVIRPAIERGLTRQIGFVAFGGGWELLNEAKRISRNIFINPLVIWPFSEVFDNLEYVEADAITIGWGWRGWNHWKLIPGKLEKLIEEAGDHGCQVWGGLAATSFQIEWLMRWGFNGAWVDDIVMAREVMEAIEI